MSDRVQSPGRVRDRVRDRVRAQAIVLLLLAFLAGAFAGGAIERLSHGRRADWPSRGGFMGGIGRGGYGGRVGGGFPAIYDSLDLSPAQRVTIDSIMLQQRPTSDSLRKAIGANMNVTRTAVEAVFTPAQKAKADLMRARFDSTMHARGGGRTHTDSGRARPF
jgi:Spy/CpxP family protein refolding chaperone